MGHVSDLNGAALYLASDASAFTSGSDLIIDGSAPLPSFPPSREADELGPIAAVTALGDARTAKKKTPRTGSRPRVESVDERFLGPMDGQTKQREGGRSQFSFFLSSRAFLQKSTLFPLFSPFLVIENGMHSLLSPPPALSMRERLRRRAADRRLSLSIRPLVFAGVCLFPQRTLP